jgi:hypothetical protein
MATPDHLQSSPNLHSAAGSSFMEILEEEEEEEEEEHRSLDTTLGDYVCVVVVVRVRVVVDDARV